jgi:hypothetical protein
MASVCVMWDPYDRAWMAKADWSGEPSTEVVTEGHSDPAHALYELSILLDAKRENERPIKNDRLRKLFAEPQE